MVQRAMGHSSLQVGLTYLRGLEVTELTNVYKSRVFVFIIQMVRI